MSNGADDAGKTIAVHDSDFASAVENNGFIVVDFWAPWCRPCTNLSPAIDALALKFDGRVVFAKMNIDDNPKTPSQYAIMSIPTLLFFKDGTLVDRVSGPSPQTIEQMIDKHI